MITINIEKACYNNDVVSLKDFNLKVEDGEIVTILGKSGCGKSTLLKIIAGLHTRYFGDIQIDNGDIIGYIPQNKCLLPWKSVYENIILLKKIRMKIDESVVFELLNKLGIYHLKDQYSNRLSGGEYQRVVLGQVFFNEPKVLLMDEPFSALDMETKKEIMDLFLAMHKERNLSTIFVTHDTFEAEYMAGRIIRL